MKELLITLGQKELFTIPVIGDSFRVGRAPTNDFRFPDETVSRNQFELLHEGEKWLFKDRSGKGMVVDSELRDEMELTDSSLIELGEYRIKLRDVPKDNVTTAAALSGDTNIMKSEDTPSCETMTLTGDVGGKKIKEVLSDPVVNIGSGDDNEIIIKEFGVSGNHCQIYQSKGAWWLLDLDSKNGTLLNGRKIKEATIWPGMIIGLGKVKLEVLAGKVDSAYPSFCGIISQDPEMKPVFELIEQVAPSDQIILITGETGTGKELVAKAIHRMSIRSGKKIVVKNCSAFSKDLIDSEIFGHKKGSFTGALSDKKGVFEEANGGSLFLDEIGELTMEAQAKLLRTIDNGEVTRVGENVARKVDTRLIAATHRSLEEMVSKGTFRQDLFYRINVIDINIPPLRKRTADIQLLAQYFLDTSKRGSNLKLSDSAIEKLLNYNYPGNVRELNHTITKAVWTSRDETIGPEKLFFTPTTVEAKIAAATLYRKGVTVENVEEEMIRKYLKVYDGNKTATAEALGGWSRPRLDRKMKKYGIDVDKIVR
jgi:DNA-binding NtrC family response regulator